MTTDLSSLIRALALAEGFDAIGFAPARLPESAREGLEAYLAAGHHGDMQWMEARKELRADPSALWPQARSVIALGVNYAPEESPMEALGRKNHGVIAAYAQRKDYHDVIKGRLKRLCQRLHSAHGGEFKVFVDTAPVMEKPLAAQSALGWQGKHTCLVSREHGSWLLLGEIFTTLEIRADAPHANHCGACTRCLDICPTHAFTQAGKLDSRRCLAYLTIEHAGHIPPEFREPMGNRVFGCDDCLAVCPWNKFAQTSRDAAMALRPEHASPSLAELLTLDDAAFRLRFSGTPVKRTGRERFLRNALIAAGNSGDASLAARAEALLQDPSPLIRAMAVWALARLLPEDAFADLRPKYCKEEEDAYVRREWEILTT